jgi:hypothetical protein
MAYLEGTIAHAGHEDDTAALVQPVRQSELVSDSEPIQLHGFVQAHRVGGCGSSAKRSSRSAMTYAQPSLRAWMARIAWEENCTS